jgi:hypothetical protein
MPPARDGVVKVGIMEILMLPINGGLWVMKWFVMVVAYGSWFVTMGIFGFLMVVLWVVKRGKS